MLFFLLAQILHFLCNFIGENVCAVRCFCCCCCWCCCFGHFCSSNSLSTAVCKEISAHQGNYKHMWLWEVHRSAHTYKPTEPLAGRHKFLTNMNNVLIITAAHLLAHRYMVEIWKIMHTYIHTVVYIGLSI